MSLSDFVKQHEWQSFCLTINLPHPAGPRPWPVDFVVFPFAKVKKREEDGANLYNYFLGWKGEAFERVEKGEWIPFGAGGMSATAIKYDNGFRESGNLGLLAADSAGSKLIYLPRKASGPPEVLATALGELFGGKVKKTAAKKPAAKPKKAGTARVKRGVSKLRGR